LHVIIGKFTVTIRGRFQRNARILAWPTKAITYHQHNEPYRFSCFIKIIKILSIWGR